MQRVFLHGRNEETPVGRDGDVEMRALPFQRLRPGVRARKPQARAVVMRDGEPVALGHEGQPARGRRQVERFCLATGAPCARDAAGGPGDCPVAAQSHGVDPFAALVGDKRRSPPALVETSRPSSPPVMIRTPSLAAQSTAPSLWAAARVPLSGSVTTPCASAKAGASPRKAAAITASSAVKGVTEEVRLAAASVTGKAFFSRRIATGGRKDLIPLPPPLASLKAAAGASCGTGP